MTADTQSSRGVEHVKADPIVPVFAIPRTIHAKCPLLLAHPALSQPVDIPAPFGTGKLKGSRSDPRRYRQLAGRDDAEHIAVGDPNEIINPIEVHVGGWR